MWQPQVYEKVRDEIVPLIKGDTKNFVKRFQFVKKFGVKSSQGISGILKSTETKSMLVFKISKDLDYVVRHESGIMRELSRLKKFCPHFCGWYQTVSYPVNYDYENADENPFEPTGNFKLDICLSQYIPKSVTLTKQLRTNSRAQNFSIVKQVLMALEFAQLECEFTHYDLHTDNILIDRTHSNTIFLYKLNNHIYGVPTHGNVPIIIDFGFSHTLGSSHRRMYASQNHTTSGYTPSMFDKINDLKLFLCGLSYDLVTKAETKDDQDRYDTFRTTILKQFKPLKINTENGWDLSSKSDKSVFKQLKLEFAKITDKLDGVWNTKLSDCLEMLQSSIYLPLTESNDELDIADTFELFYGEWYKIEKEISVVYTKLYTLFVLIDQISEKVPKSSADLPYSDPKWIRDFRLAFNKRIDRYIKYWVPPTDVDYSRLVLSVLVLGSKIKRFYGAKLRLIADAKNQTRRRLTFTSPLDMYHILDANFPTPLSAIGSDLDVWLWNFDEKVYSRTSLKLNKTEFTEFKSLKTVHQPEWLYDQLKIIDASKDESD